MAERCKSATDRNYATKPAMPVPQYHHLADRHGHVSCNLRRVWIISIKALDCAGEVRYAIFGL
jgi:hypothetical protein